MTSSSFINKNEIEQIDNIERSYMSATGKEKLNTDNSLGDSYASLTSGKNVPYWISSSSTLKFTPLTSDIEVDVAIVGAGIAGLSIAYSLIENGKSVAILEDGYIGSGETGRTTAHLASALDDHYFEIQRIHGKESAKLVADSHKKAIDRIEEIVRKEKIECEFRRVNAYMFAHEESAFNILEKEYQAANECGVKTEWVERAPVPGVNTQRALKFSYQAQFHPFKYITALAKILKGRGCQIYTETKVTNLQGGKEFALCKTDQNKSVKSKWVVQACNVPINDMITMHAKQEAYRSYVVALEVPKGYIEPALFYDTLDPYHYVRMTEGPQNANYDIIISGGEDHKVAINFDYKERLKRLEEWTRKFWPKAGKVSYHWSGQVIEPHDFLAFIGKNPSDFERVLICTADSGNGMTHGVVASFILTDKICGRVSPYAEIYSPSRLNISVDTAYEMLKHNVTVQSQFIDYATGGDVSDIEDIKPGCGAIVRQGLSKHAVYRDTNNKVHKCSAVCPHLKGLVRWNEEEKSWDCPIHGSRFDPLGGVVCGPSKSNLSPIT